MPEIETKPNSLVPPARNGSKLKLDISLARLKDGTVGFGKSAVNVSGSLSHRTVVTDNTIHIHFPEESCIRTLNLIYNKHGHPNLPEKSRNGVYSLLTEKRHDLVHVEPVATAEAPKLLKEIHEGNFDLIATAIKNDKDFPVGTVGAVSEHLPQTELQLIRVWKTGKFYTFNKASGKLNKLHDKRTKKLTNFTNAVDKFRILPGVESWNYTSGDSANYFKKYLMQDELESKLAKSQRHAHSLPEVNRGIPQLEKGFSFHTETKDSFYNKAVLGKVPLHRSLTDRSHPARLTRSNILRHEFHQSRRPLPTISTVFFEMENSKGRVFDAEDALQEQNLKCPTCNDFYSTRERNPCVLYCLHSCCEACLKTRIRNEMARCPVCSEVQEVPNNELKLLPVDHARHHLVKFYKVRYHASEIGCDSCDPRIRATHRCKECDDFLCGVCTEAHKRTNVTKIHTVVNIEHLRRSNLEEFHHKRTCQVPEHEEQHFNFYCYSKGCDMPICSLCAVTDHPKSDDHDIRNINDVYVENKLLVESLMIDVKHKRNLAEEAIQRIEDEIRNLFLKVSITDDEIDQSFLACQKQLEKRKNELKEKLAATSKAKKKGMESQLDKLISEKNSLDHAAKFSSNVLDYSDFIEFFHMKDALFDRLGELKEMEVDTRPHHKADMKFHGPNMLEAFQKFSNDMGEVWSTSAFIPNTQIQTYDISLGREETTMIITLHDYERRPLAEPGVDIRVEITNPQGLVSRAQVIETDGAYKVIYQGQKLGDHRARVFVMGLPVIESGVTFKVRKQTDLEADVLGDYELEPVVSSKPGAKAITDTGLEYDYVDDFEPIDQKLPARSYRVFGDILCPDFSFDPTTCHPQNTVTADYRTLKNVRGHTANIGTALKNYRGAIGTRAFSTEGRFYFEVLVYFFIKRQLRNDLIFEMAIAHRSEIDSSHSLDGSHYAWTVCARRCPSCHTVCLMAFHSGIKLFHLPLTDNCSPGTTFRTTVGLLVDTKQKQWFIVDTKNRQLFYRFKGIDTSKQLWPVFGAYRTECVSVSLALRTGKDIQSVPDIPADM